MSSDIATVTLEIRRRTERLARIMAKDAGVSLEWFLSDTLNVAAENWRDEIIDRGSGDLDPED